MTNRPIKLFISDIRSAAHSPVLLTALLFPVILTIFLLYLFPLMSGTVDEHNNFNYIRSYSITCITLISAIPLIYGMLFSFIHLSSPPNGKQGESKIGFESRDAFRMRIWLSAFLTFIVVLTVIYLTDAVSTEGWLRSIYAAILLTFTGLFIFLLSVSVLQRGDKWKVIFLISSLFLLTVPTGLLLHHPWNYFIFFSPLYWTSWAWVIASPAESLVYGLISAALTVTGMLVCYFALLREPKAG